MEIGKPKVEPKRIRHSRWLIPVSTIRKLPPGGFIAGIEEDEKDMYGNSHVAIVWRFRDFSGPRIAYFDINTGEYIGDGFVEDYF